MLGVDWSEWWYRSCMEVQVIHCHTNTHKVATQIAFGHQKMTSQFGCLKWSRQVLIVNLCANYDPTFLSWLLRRCTKSAKRHEQKGNKWWNLAISDEHILESSMTSQARLHISRLFSTSSLFLLFAFTIMHRRGRVKTGKAWSQSPHEYHQMNAIKIARMYTYTWFHHLGTGKPQNWHMNSWQSVRWMPHALSSE